MFLRLITLYLQSDLYFMLTLAPLRITIISNIPAKPSKFVFANLMLKLCGFSFSSTLKFTSRSMQPHWFCSGHRTKTEEGVV